VEEQQRRARPESEERKEVDEVQKRGRREETFNRMGGGRRPHTTHNTNAKSPQGPLLIVSIKKATTPTSSPPFSFAA
jgi:hypothetical protein